MVLYLMIELQTCLTLNWDFRLSDEGVRVSMLGAASPPVDSLKWSYSGLQNLNYSNYAHIYTKKIIWFLESFRSEMYGRIAIKVWVWCFLLLLSIRLLKFRNFNLFMLSFQWATESKSNARCLVDYHSWQQYSCVRVMISDQITDYLSDEN